MPHNHIKQHKGPTFQAGYLNQVEP